MLPQNKAVDPRGGSPQMVCGSRARISDWSCWALASPEEDTPSDVSIEHTTEAAALPSAAILDASAPPIANNSPAATLLSGEVVVSSLPPAVEAKDLRNRCRATFSSSIGIFIGGAGEREGT